MDSSKSGGAASDQNEKGAGGRGEGDDDDDADDADADADDDDGIFCDHCHASISMTRFHHHANRHTLIAALRKTSSLTKHNRGCLVAIILLTLIWTLSTDFLDRASEKKIYTTLQL